MKITGLLAAAALASHGCIGAHAFLMPSASVTRAPAMMSAAPRSETIATNTKDTDETALFTTTARTRLSSAAAALVIAFSAMGTEQQLPAPAAPAYTVAFADTQTDAKAAQPFAVTSGGEAMTGGGLCVIIKPKPKPMTTTS